MYEASVEAGVPVATLRREVRMGSLRSVRITGCHYILREDLKRWMNGLPPRDKAVVDSFQQLCGVLNDPKFLKSFKKVPQFADFVKAIITNPQSNSKRNMENER